MNDSAAGEILEEGDPAKDPRAFRACLGQFGTGVAVVTARTADGGLAAMTINSFASVSLDPPLVLWSVALTSRNAPLFAGAPGFVVNILGARQTGVAHHFASSRRDRSADAGFLVAQAQAPMVAGAVAHFECALETTYAGGDHTILIGRVTRFARSAGRPLLFVQGQYGVPEPHPDFIAERTASATAAAPASGAADLVAEIFEARNLLSRRFEKHRLSEGIDLAAGRVLRRVQETPGIDRAGLLAATFLGELQLDEAIAALLARGLMQPEAGGYVLTGEGLQRRQAVKRRWDEFQETQTRGIARQDLDVARAVLRKLIERE